jgi:transforming growth factor-beta-induced protein
MPPLSQQTVFDIVSETAEFQTFEVVKTAAGLGDLLGDKDASLTVFGPSNRAFDVIEPSYLESLLTPSYNLQLVSLASFHVFSGANLTTPALTNGLVLTMLNREDVSISRNAPGVFPEIQLITSSVDDGTTPIVNITETVDLVAANGVLHEIDSVLFPQWYFSNTTDVILSSPGEFQLLRAIIDAVNFNPASSTVTIFGPNDSALSGLPEETRAFLQLPENFEVMRQILEYHVVDSLLPFTKLPQGESSTQTLMGEFVTIHRESEPMPTFASVTVNGIAIERFSLGRSVIMYEISRVLIPPNLVPTLPGIGANQL